MLRAKDFQYLTFFSVVEAEDLFKLGATLTLPVLSIKNFNYVRRPLGLNNAAYEPHLKGEAAQPEVNKRPPKPVSGGTVASSNSSKSKNF